MMRGEVAAPDEGDRRGRKPWQPKEKRGEGDNPDAQTSPTLGPKEDPFEVPAAADVAHAGTRTSKSGSKAEEREAKESRLPSPGPASPPSAPPAPISSPGG